MAESLGSLSDRRLPPFCFQTHAAVDAVRARFKGQQRATALGVYLVLSEVANRAGGVDARANGFSARRKEIAQAAGVSVDTLDRYVKAFEEIGLLVVEREQIGAVNMPNTWALTEPPEVEVRTSAPPSRTSAATLAAPVRPNARGVSSTEETTPKKTPSPRSRAASPAEHLGERRWRISSSRKGHTPHVVDLTTSTCDCESQTFGRETCAHVERATQAEAVMLKNAVWDVCVELEGAPVLKGQKNERGKVVGDMVILLEAGGGERSAKQWQHNVRSRYEALAREWGEGKVNFRSLMRDWNKAGKLARKWAGTVSTVEQEETEEQRERRRRYTRA